MTELFSIGSLYPSDFLAPGEEPRTHKAELRLVMDDDTGVVHLAEQPAPEFMWGRYWYRSGTNATMRAELHDIVTEIQGLVPLEDGDLWVDIACNDGTLLAEVPHGVVRVGVDPVEGDIHDEAEKHAHIVMQEPFTEKVGRRVRHELKKAKVVTCVAMFYDLPDPTDFLAGVKTLLADDGVFVLQMSYTPLMLRQLAFDNICHEHARYYTLTTLAGVLRDADLQVIDVALNDTNGGSFRVTCRHFGAAPIRTRPWRDVALARRDSLLSWEETMLMNTPAPWRYFWDQILKLRADVMRFVEQARGRGETIWGYGASTKGNTLLQFFGLTGDHIDAIAERQPGKVGLRTVGSNIPIRSEDDMRAARPDYLLVLPWQFVAEFTERESAYLADGGRLVVVCPRFEVIGDGPDMAIGDGRRPA